MIEERIEEALAKSKNIPKEIMLLIKQANARIDKELKRGAR